MSMVMNVLILVAIVLGACFGFWCCLQPLIVAIRRRLSPYNDRLLRSKGGRSHEQQTPAGPGAYAVESGYGGTYDNSAYAESGYGVGSYGADDGGYGGGGYGGGGYGGAWGR
jgi:uncharacterized membrane protein YgcG